VSPHMVVVAAGAPEAGSGLVVGAALREIAAADRGSEAHADITARMTAAAMQEAGISDPAEVGLVLIRAPIDPARPGHDPAVRTAAALGVARAMGEAPPATFARCCFVVARHDDEPQQVLVLGNAVGGNSSLRIGSGLLADPIDSPGAARILEGLGLHACPQLSEADSSRVVAGDRQRGCAVWTGKCDPAGTSWPSTTRRRGCIVTPAPPTGRCCRPLIGHTCLLGIGRRRGPGPPGWRLCRGHCAH